jgi:hypothetical protein
MFLWDTRLCNQVDTSSSVLYLTFISRKFCTTHNSQLTAHTRVLKQFILEQYL